VGSRPCPPGGANTSLHSRARCNRSSPPERPRRFTTEGTAAIPLARSATSPPMPIGNQPSPSSPIGRGPIPKSHPSAPAGLSVCTVWVATRWGRECQTRNDTAAHRFRSRGSGESARVSPMPYSTRGRRSLSIPSGTHPEGTGVRWSSGRATRPPWRDLPAALLGTRQTPVAT
jgi:hypothetical protein